MTEGRVIIAGGGIGGLATALALSAKGRRIIVLERAAVLGEVGAGIQLGPNAFHALDKLKVGDIARTEAVYIDQLRLMNAVSGEEIVHIDLDDGFRQRFGNPYAVVHRGDLHKAMLTACQDDPKIELKTGCQVERYEQDDSKIVVVLASGERVEGDILIGADGLRSAVRRQMVNDGPPRIEGHTTYRSVIPVDQMPEDLRWNAATLWAGERCHLVHYPLQGWKVFNLAITTHNDANELIAGKPVSHDEVMQGFKGIHPRIRSLIEHGKDWKAWVICDREPVQQWRDGRAVLLGDAAHPMLQYFAQGACMALEDAVCLADALERERADWRKALDSYVASRSLRTARVQLQSRELAKHVYHPAGAHAALRDQLLKSLGNEGFYQSIDWLYRKGAAEAASIR